MRFFTPSTSRTQARISRRSFVRMGLAAGAGLVLPLPALARAGAFAAPEKTLSLYNTHTGESLREAVYWAQGEYVPEAVAEISYILRDHRSDQVKPIDPELFDLLFVLRRKLESKQEFQVISGYRSPATNAALRRQSAGVAKHSLHMEGRAIDLRLPGRDLADLRKAAMALKRGGVGYYPRSDFVHVDTGRVRCW